MSIDYKSAPFDEAISYLENRIALPSERWNDFKDSEADAIFWSAGAVDATLVSDLQKAVTRAVANGTPYDSPEFASLIQNFSTNYGWDIKGGAEWRSRLILTQNVRQAYAAGRQQQQFDPDAMKLQPFLQYQHSDSRAPRPAHLALDGKVFKKDDPILSSIYPPNGFGCGCFMTSLSPRQMAKKGLEATSIALGDTLPYIDSNGQTKQAIVAPDKGFNAMPNASSGEQRQQILERAIARLPDRWGEAVQGTVTKALSALPSGSQPTAPSLMDKNDSNWQEYARKGKELIGEELIAAHLKTAPTQAEVDAHMKPYLAKVEAFKRKYADKEITQYGERKLKDLEYRAEFQQYNFESIAAETAEARALIKKIFLQRTAESEDLANKIDISKDVTKMRREGFWRGAMADFYTQTGGKGSTSLGELFLDPEDRAYALRSYSNKKGTINVGNEKEIFRETLFHEMGHHLEFENPALAKSARQFVLDRATGKPEKLSKLTGNDNYGDDETAIPDKFIDPYVGKLYDDDSTEVIAMGIEKFSSRVMALELLRKDPDHFFFVLGAMRS